MDRTIFISGPDPKLELVYSDVWLPGLYSRRVFVFQLPPTSSHEKAIAVLERALQVLVEGTPELGGESVVVPAEEHDGQMPWRAIRAYKGIELVIKDGMATGVFPSYAELEQRGFPLAAFKDRELMPIPTGIAPEPQPVAKFQATLIDGGILLSTCLYHHLADGNGMNSITRALGAACKRAAETPAAVPPVVLNTDRSGMRVLNGSQTDLALHPAYSIVPGVYLPGAIHDAASALVAAAPSADETANVPTTAGGNEADAPASAPPLPTGFVPGFFRLTDAKATQLKADASVHTACSTHDAISALLWRTLILARVALGRVAATDRTLFTFPHNARRHVGLPSEWVGNCVYFCIAETDVDAMTGSDAAEALAQLAAQIRGCLNAVDHERVAGLMTLRRLDPYSLAWWPVGTPGEPRYVSITSFYQSGLLGIDWGAAWGSVKHFTSTDVGAMGDGFERVSFVGPKIGGGRGCDVLVAADDDELGFFRKDALWNRYFEPLPSEPLGT